MAHGDTLLSSTTNLPIETITIRQGTFTVITITTERNHNFFVSANDLLVHNFLPLIGHFLVAIGITGTTSSVAVGTGGTMAMATATGTGTLATTGAVPAALATTSTIITTATTTATGVASSLTTTLALADAALKSAIAAKGIIAGSLAAKVAPVAAGAIIAQVTNRFLGNNTATEEHSLETTPTHSRETIPQPLNKTVQQTVIEPTARDNDKSLMHGLAQEIKKEVALQQGNVVAMDKDMDQELKKETKPREELYIPIKINFMNYDVQIDDLYVEDGGEMHHYLVTETTFADAPQYDEHLYETHETVIDLWTPAMYEQQWREGIERIKTHDTSCLMLDVKKRYLDYWMLYKIGDKIHIQEHYLFDVPNQNAMIYTERVGNSIVTPQNCYQFCAPPEDRYSNEPDEYGLRASEWVVPIITMKRSTA
ncbi:hypothetical protein M1466_01795 [Candidatus Dependentiae bacterium]|nr:hypothetical protein [Candidatus Dependentiae bacterium]